MPAPITIATITLGCAKNEVDSRTMNTRLENAGYLLSDNLETADCIVVNTCAFIQIATEESLDAIFDASREAKPGAKIIVAGCLPSRYGDELAGELHEAHAFVTCSKEDDIVSIVDALFDRQVPQAAGSQERFNVDETSQYGDVSTYIKISDGCNRFCSFCTIPYIRGRYQSYSYETIREEVKRAVEQGTKEIVLIAQDTGIWGSDFPEARSLGWLVDTLASEFYDTWFRVMYVQPDGITDELLSAMASHANVCSYLDMPIQHCEKHLLSSMNRHGSKEELLNLVERIRQTIPDVTLRTTVMVGYPGETDEDFESLIDFLDDVQFDYVGVFEFSPEEGTRAFKLENQVDEETKHERYQRVRDLCDSISVGKISEHVGTRLDVLIEGVDEDGHPFGRTQRQAPEVDGVTFVEDVAVGHIASVMIEDSLYYDMEGSAL